MFIHSQNVWNYKLKFSVSPWTNEDFSKLQMRDTYTYTLRLTVWHTLDNKNHISFLVYNGVVSGSWIWCQSPVVHQDGWEWQTDTFFILFMLYMLYVRDESDLRLRQSNRSLANASCKCQNWFSQCFRLPIYKLFVLLLNPICDMVDNWFLLFPEKDNDGTLSWR